jgi:hypothetical protein
VWQAGQCDRASARHGDTDRAQRDCEHGGDADSGGLQDPPTRSVLVDEDRR